MAGAAEELDLVVIGAGPGGYVAAVRAAQHGLRVAIVEKDSRLGGTCLLRGCIPTKAMLHSADLLEQLRGAAAFGVHAGDIRLDFAGVGKARDAVVKKSAAGVDYLMRTHKIAVHKGTASFVDAHTVQVAGGKDTTKLCAKHFIVATGSEPRQLPHIPIDGVQTVTSTELLALDTIPAQLAVLGAGAVGVEFASVFRRFGSEVSVIELQDRLLPLEDEEIGREFERCLRRRGITCLTSTKLVEVKRGKAKDAPLTLHLEHDGKTSTQEVTTLLVAVGRMPITEALQLSAAGIEVDKGGYIPVDGCMRTKVAHIYAIGDVVRTPWLAHVASAEGILASDAIAGHEARPIDYLNSPSCVYADPEVGSVGLSEADARARGHSVKVGKFPFSAVAKMRIGGHTEGFVKLVTETRYGEILGVHILGEHATELIAAPCIAKSLECTAEELAHMIFAHPTRAEGIGEAAHAAVGRALHL